MDVTEQQCDQHEAQVCVTSSVAACDTRLREVCLDTTEVDCTQGGDTIKETTCELTSKQ